MYLRHWKLFLAVFILSIIPAVLYLNLYPRTYEFAASILLQDEKESAMSSIGLGEAASLMKSFGIGTGGEGINIEDEMEILASKRLFSMVILDLGINVIYSEPFSLYSMYHEAPLKLTTDSATMANLHDEYLFKVYVTPGAVRVKVKSWLGQLKKTWTFSSLPAVMTIDGEVFTLDFDNDGSKKGTFKLKIKVKPASWRAEELIKKVEIEDISSASNVLTISHSDHVMRRGLDLLNSLIRIYNEDMESYKRYQADNTLVFVNRRIGEILSQLELVETNLQDFKKKKNLTLLESDVTLYGELFKELITAVTEEEAKAYQIDLLEKYLNDPANKDKAIPMVFSVSDNDKSAIAQYNKLIVEREKVLKYSNEDNYLVQTFSAQAEVLREGVSVMITNARKGVMKTLDDLKTQENELLSKFKSIPESEREYVGYIRDQEILQGLYLLMLQKREEAIVSVGKKLDRARVIEPPFIKKKPLGPRKLFAGIGMIVFTLIVPVVYLFVKDLIISIKRELKDNS